MFKRLKNKRMERLDRIEEWASNYIKANYVDPAPSPQQHMDHIRYCIDDTEEEIEAGRSYSVSTVPGERPESVNEKPDASGQKPGNNNAGIQYSVSKLPSPSDVLRDNYSSDTVQNVLRGLSSTGSTDRLVRMLQETTNMSFVTKMLEHINRKHLRDAQVYKAAQLDRRLFSKIVSDWTYKPSKDTCIAICYALKLSLPETNDMLSRAGYTLSHSSERDVILEYFFQAQVYDLCDINEILYRLKQKTLGR